MPWYYAGPEAKPVGPVSAEQLQGLFASGTITSETFVIEHTGPGAAGLAWKRYREAFPPTAATLPPIPFSAPTPVAPPAPTPPMPGSVPAPTPSAPFAATPHPLFPSAGTPQPGHPEFRPVPQSYAYPIRPTNSWCAWGFALSLVGLCLAIFCIGVVPALIAAVLCIIGLVQVTKNNREQGGMGLAITGLIFSGVTVLLFAILLCVFGPAIVKGHGLTVTEQTSNDSE